MSGQKHWLRQSRLFAVAVPLGTSVLFPQHAGRMDAPFVAFFLLASVWAIAIAALSRPEALRKCALLCSSLLFCLAVIETCLYHISKSQIIITRTTPQAWL